MSESCLDYAAFSFVLCSTRAILEAQRGSRMEREIRR